MTKRVEDQPKEWQEKYHKAHAQLKVKKMDRMVFDNTLAVVREIRKEERDTVLGELEEIDSQSLEDVQVELDQERKYRQYGKDALLDELEKNVDDLHYGWVSVEALKRRFAELHQTKAGEHP